MHRAPMALDPVDRTQQAINGHHKLTRCVLSSSATTTLNIAVVWRLWPVSWPSGSRAEESRSCGPPAQKVQNYFGEFVRFRTAPLYIPNGIATEIFKPVSRAESRCLRARLALPQDEPVMLFVGRFVERKGLKILRSLAQLFRECHWVFVGWGPMDPATWGLLNVSCPGSLDRAHLIPYFQ